MKTKLTLIFSWTLFVSLSGCANPTALIKDDIDRFKNDYPSQIISIHGRHREIRYAFAGDPSKRPLVFVHGSPGSWEGWAHFLLDENLKREFHIIAIDRPGYGGSGFGVTERSLENQADEVLAVLDQNESGLPAILAGHSFGGPVIARAAMLAPDKVAGLVFVASSVDPSLERTKWYQYPASWWPIRALIPTELRVCNEEILTLKAELQAILSDWSKISAVVSIAQGLDDDLVPKENADFILAQVSSKQIASVQKIEALNHFVPWKRPDAIEKAVFDVEKKIQASREEK